MTDYAVNFSSMEDAQNGLNQVYQQLGQIGSDLNDQVQKGTVNFVGDTKDQFQTAFIAYQKAYGDLDTKLKAAIGALQGVAEEYSHGEKLGVGMWAQ